MAHGQGYAGGPPDTLTIQILQTIGAVFVICSGTLRHSDLTVFLCVC